MCDKCKLNYQALVKNIKCFINKISYKKAYNKLVERA